MPNGGEDNSYRCSQSLAVLARKVFGSSNKLNPDASVYEVTVP